MAKKIEMADISYAVDMIDLWVHQAKRLIAKQGEIERFFEAHTREIRSQLKIAQDLPTEEVCCYLDGIMAEANMAGHPTIKLAMEGANTLIRLRDNTPLVLFAGVLRRCSDIMQHRAVTEDYPTGVAYGPYYLTCDIMTMLSDSIKYGEQVLEMDFNLEPAKPELDVAMGIEHNAEIAREFIWAASANDDLTSDNDPCTASIIRNICSDIEFERGVDVGEYVWVYAYDLFAELTTSSADTIKARLYTYADFATRYQAPVYKYGPEYVEAEREVADYE